MNTNVNQKNITAFLPKSEREQKFKACGARVGVPTAPEAVCKPRLSPVFQKSHHLCDAGATDAAKLLLLSPKNNLQFCVVL